MKSLVFPSLIALAGLAATGCNNGSIDKESVKDTAAVKVVKQTTDSSSNAKDTGKGLEGTTIEVVLKPSTEHFNAALSAFEKKDTKMCIEAIAEGIKSFHSETEKRKGKAKELALIMEKQLEGLDTKVEKGLVKDINVLKRSFHKAEHIDRYQSFVLVGDLFVPEKQTEIKPALVKALDDLSLAVGEEKGQSKSDGEKIIKQGRELEKKLDSDKKVTKKEVDDYVLEVNKWIERHIR